MPVVCQDAVTVPARPVTVSSMGVSVPAGNAMGAWLVNRPPPASAMGIAVPATDKVTVPPGTGATARL